MSLISKTTKFLNDAAGLEKSLRFFQALTQLISCHSLKPTPWVIARKQIALARRYFRIPKIIPAFTNSVTAFSPEKTEDGRLLMWLDSIRWMCQGMYLLTETCTLLDTMGVTEYQWAEWMTLEANKFWFYALSLGALIGLLQLATLSPPVSTSEQDEKEDEKKEKFADLEKKYFQKRSKVVRQLMVDSCDLVIPSGVVGWYVASCSNNSMLMLTSTLLATVDIWDRVNGTG